LTDLKVDSAATGSFFVFLSPVPWSVVVTFEEGGGGKREGGREGCGGGDDWSIFEGRKDKKDDRCLVRWW
jgi:hypothetical protein